MGKDQELLDASRSGNIAQVGKLLEQIAKRSSGPLSSFRRSPSINSQDVNGYTPLHHACLNGHSNIVRLLLAHDAASDVPDIRGSTPLYLAAWAGHQDIVKMLLMHPRKPANPNAQTTDNETPLHSAAQHGHNAALAILLAYGADPTIRNNSFQTALDLAAQFGRLQSVQLLIRTHPALIEPYKATTASTFDLTNYLPQNFAATSPTKHIFTHTCLHLASRNGHKKVVETLLAAGVDVNTSTHAGSALHEAALCGKKSVVIILLEAGIDPYAKDGNGRTALDLLKDYPPHVTYEIATVIRDFCKTKSDECHFRPINAIEDENEENFITTTENDIREKSHSIPKSACIKKLNDHTKKFIKVKSGLSSSLDSLEKMPPVPDNYLQMKPINRKKTSEESIESIPRSIYGKYYSKFLNNNNLTNERSLEQDIANKTATLQQFEVELRSLMKNELTSVKPSETTYYCVDEYVQMTDPNKRNSNSSPTKTIQYSANDIDMEDYNKIQNLTNTNLERSHESSTSVTPTNPLSLDANNNKQHSPTPDFPPPSVSQAEYAILEFIHPPRPMSKKSNKRRSIHIDYIENGENDLESFIAERFNSNEEDEEIDTSLLRPKPITPLSSTRNSECVEEFVGDKPFAGLFKGSSLNLNHDEVDGFVRPPSRLRSPSLVRSVQPIPPKRNIVNSIHVNGEVLDDEFNATQVWDEINSILQSIDNEMRSEEEKQFEDEKIINEETSETIKPPPCLLATPKPIKIRNPSELLLGMKSDAEAKWCHSPNTLIYGQIIYEVYYLGSTVIRSLQGTISTRKSIQKLKRGETPLANERDSSILENCNTSTKFLKTANEQTRLQVGIAISHEGVRFIDVTEKSTICLHNIQNINCVCQDAEDLRYFAYITKEEDLHYCHVFMVDSTELATEIILTLGEAFEVAYQLTLVKESNSQ